MMHCISTKHAVLGETGDRTGIKEGTMQIILLYPIKILILKKKFILESVLLDTTSSIFMP